VLSSVADLADHLAAQLLPSGYEFLVIDGGWTTSHVTLPNGSAYTKQNIDEWGRPIPAPERYKDMKALAEVVHGKGLKLGLWTIRGAHRDAVARKLPIKNTNYTIDQIIDTHSKPGAGMNATVGTGGANMSCLWAGEWLGVNTSHPAAQAYYDSRAELLESYGTDFIKADCFMCQPCYTKEIEMFSSAVRKLNRSIVLSYSPGGGNSPENGSWVAREQLASMYRVVTDFHGGWGALQQNIFAAGNFTNFATGSLFGLNGTFGDLDMLPMSESWWAGGVGSEKYDLGQTIFSLYMISRAPLMHAGRLPVDPVTRSFLTNKAALLLHAKATAVTVEGYKGNCSCALEHHHYNPSLIVPGTCSIPADASGPPCIVTWSAEFPGGLDVPQQVWMHINMGHNATVVAVPAGAVDIWTGANLSTQALRPHASLLYTLPKTVR
jgi:alpha-galactosidase